MKTDRELLELAAKAAGYEFKWEATFCGLGKEQPTVFNQESGMYWNPLADDGDALRLAAKLDFTIYQVGQKAHVEVIDHDIELFERHGNDKCAATRRAIVRAAAAIGEAM